MTKGFLLSLVFICAVAFSSLLPAGCGNIIPPAGGPRDSLPPILVKADPADSTVNFHGSHITLSFDELVDLRDLSNNVLFTPSFENNPVITAKGRTLTLRFKDSLEPNTTYVLNFGNAIVDINEGNVLRNFMYTFATGPFLDSLELNGKVVLAETGGIDTTLIAVLQKKLYDSAVTERPLYAVRLDKDGNFHFRNLPADTFALYVLGESKRYSERQLFGFLDQPVIAGKADSLLVYAYHPTPPVSVNLPASLPSRTGAGDRRLRYTQPAGALDLQRDFVLNFVVPLRNLDSSKLHLTTDSTFAATSYSVALDSTRRELHIKSQWKENTNYNLVLEKDFATDTNGRQLLKTDTLFFTTKKLADYGDLTLRFRNLDLSKHPVLQFVQNGQVTLSVPLTSAVLTQKLFTPGDYDLRILYDTNGNGKWDPGQFFGGKKRQPEIVKPVDRKITVKPNWENEMEIAL